MAYSNVGIVNMALQRIGAKSSVTTLDPPDGSPNSIKAYAVWEYILDEVLETVKPKFATVRRALSQSTTDPINTDVYEYSYPLPADFICFADDYKDDLAVWPQPGIEPYVIEAANDGTLCLFTNYDSTEEEDDVYITYVRKVVDPAKFSPSFINCLCYRLAAELTLSVAESGSKFEFMMKMYGSSLKKAKAGSRGLDYFEDEKGSDSWEDAGR